jgi:hypothetical protein
MYVCGTDHANKCNINSGIKRNMGVIIVGREKDSII